MALLNRSMRRGIVRVLMTGGYGCIGAWVVRQLLDEGQDVWIFDLKEDTHRIDLLVEPEIGRAHV